MTLTSNYFQILLCTLLLFYLVNLNAGSIHKHGQSHMTVVLEDSTLSMSLKLSAFDTIGFEHQPSSKKEHQTIEDLLLLIHDTSSWLTVIGGVCTEEASNVSNPFILPDEQSINKISAHPDFNIEVEYSCTKPAELKGVVVSLQTLFSRINKIEVQWIVHGKQGMSVIETGKQEVSFNYE